MMHTEIFSTQYIQNARKQELALSQPTKIKNQF
jgi:hypothetical protein